MLSLRRAVAALLLLSLAVVSVSLVSAKGPDPASTLVSVQIVSRHGTRAPNPVVDKLCPNDRPNLARYRDLHITLAGLTGTGMKELHELGTYTRQQYITRTYPHFVDSFFNAEQVYFRAVGEDRTLQSAAAMGQGMFPAGHGPIGFPKDLPANVPVYTLPDDFDSLLEVRKMGCKAQLAADAKAWDNTAGKELYAANADVLKQMLALCGITDLNEAAKGSGDDFGDAIKDITDAWTFDMIEGFQMQEGINDTSLLAFRTMAVTQLLGRILGSDAQITYMNGELPERMIDNFLFNIWNQGPKPHPAPFALKLYAYHGHREMMYALAAFLGIHFDIQFPALPKGAIPPATTLFFELHYVGERDAEGRIPNAFAAAGLEDPYAQKGVLAKPPSSLGGVLPWARRQANAPRDAARSAERHTSHQDQEQAAAHQQGQHDEPSAEEQAQAAQQEPPQGAEPGDQGEDDAAAAGPHAQAALDASPAAAHGAPPATVPAAGLPARMPALRAAVTTALAKKKSAKGKAGSKAKAAPAVDLSQTWQPPPPTTGYVVRAFVWHPCGERGEVLSAEQEATLGEPESSRPDCPAVPVAMTAVCDAPAAEGCTMQQFQDAIHARIARTGDWASLCGAENTKPVYADRALVGELQPVASSSILGDVALEGVTGARAFLWGVVATGVLVALGAIGYVLALALLSKVRRAPYADLSQAEFEQAVPFHEEQQPATAQAF